MDFSMSLKVVDVHENPFQATKANGTLRNIITSVVANLRFRNAFDIEHTKFVVERLQTHFEPIFDSVARCQVKTFEAVSINFH